MLNLFYTDTSVLSSTSLERLRAEANENTLSKIKDYKNENAVRQSLASDFLFRKMCEELAIPSNTSLSYGPKGKPYFTHIKNIHFNISHSGFLVILGFSNLNLGVDIEYRNTKRKNLPALAERFFSENEIQYLNKLEAAQADLAFYRLWTLKESFFKCTGKGLSAIGEGSSFDLSASPILLTDSGNNRLTGYSFIEINEFQNYSCSVCLESEKAISPTLSYLPLC